LLTSLEDQPSDPAPAPPAPAPAPAVQPAAAPSPPPAPAPVTEPEPPKPSPAPSPRGFNPGRLIAKAQQHGANAIEWVKRNPLPAAAIGTGVALGTAVVGWLIYKAIKGGKQKGKGGRRERRSIDEFHAEFLEEFPANRLEKRAILDEIDFDDEEFLEFLSLLPNVEDILQDSY
jgi:hypothetical protein